MLGDWSLLLAAIIDKVDLDTFSLFLLFDKYLKNEVSLNKGFYVVRFIVTLEFRFLGKLCIFCMPKSSNIYLIFSKANG